MERITSESMNRTVLANNQRTLARLATYQEQLSSQKRVNKVSDDPVAAKRAMRYRAEELASGKYLDNIDKSLAYMNATDSTFSEMASALDQVKALAVQGANGSQDAASRRALSQSVDSYLTRMVDLANSVHDGRYIFGGTATSDTPFARNQADTAVDYSGNLDSFSVQVGFNATVEVNQDGFSLFKEPNDVFDTLIQLRDALKANDQSAVSGLIDAVDAAHEQVVNVQGAMGGRMQRLELTRNQLESSKVQLGELISQAEDADLPSVISNLQMTQVALEAGLQAGARVLQPTLLDFLR